MELDKKDKNTLCWIIGEALKDPEGKLGLMRTQIGAITTFLADVLESAGYLDLAGMLTEKDKKIAELQDENGRLCHGMCDIQGEISIYKKKIAELEEKIDELEPQLEESQDLNSEQARKISELEQKIEWWGNLVKRECIGTKEIPSLKAYIEKKESE